MTKTAHTPTPWSRNINWKYPIYTQHTRKDVRHICSIIQSESTTDDEKEANLRFIIQACNAHDDLVAALEEISRGAGAYSTDPLEHAGNCIDEMKALAVAALAKAKGE